MYNSFPGSVNQRCFNGEKEEMLSLHEGNPTNPLLIGTNKLFYCVEYHFIINFSHNEVK